MSRLCFILIFIFGISAGAVGRPDLQRAVMSHSKDVRACYKSALKAMPKPKSGKIVVEWAIDDKGGVSKVEIAAKKSTLRDPHLEKCLISKVQTWKLPAAPKGQTMFASFPFYLSKKGPQKANSVTKPAPKKKR